MRSVIQYSLLVCLLASCATAPPIAYYTIAMECAGGAEPGVNIVIDRVQVSEALGRRDLLIKKSPTEIEYYATAQWAASVNDLVSEKLLEEFGTPQDGRETVSLSLFVQAFDQVDLQGGGAEANAKITAEFRKDRYGDVLLKKAYCEHEPAEAAPNAIAGALSKCLERIAVSIAADASTL